MIENLEIDRVLPHSDMTLEIQYCLRRYYSAQELIDMCE
jgi:hypothetical protein